MGSPAPQLGWDTPVVWIREWPSLGSPQRLCPDSALKDQEEIRPYTDRELRGTSAWRRPPCSQQEERTEAQYLGLQAPENTAPWRILGESGFQPRRGGTLAP